MPKITTSEAAEQTRNAAPETLTAESRACDVIILCWNAPTESDHRAQKIAQFLGATVRFASLTTEVLNGSASSREIVPPCACLIMQAETLAKMSDEVTSGDPRRLLEQAEHTFIYGFQAQARHDATLQALSSGKLLGTCLSSDEDVQVRVAAEYPNWCFQFSGLSVGPADTARESAFTENRAQGAQALVRIGKRPCFVRLEEGASQYFLVAGGELADLDEKVARDSSILKWFRGLVPLMMFLRGALGTRVWHNDKSRACFIVDDPLLKSRHGFLEYQRLIESMQRNRFSTCIAFIPWNYRRSSREIAELFLSNPHAASLCIHGCDHTGAEFESTDSKLLQGKAKLALERMQVHKRLSGVSFDQVMVFPRGLFSGEALSALQAAGYLAAVNTELGPSTMPEALSLRDLLDVAVTRFGNFPVFGRRYPNDLAEFAFDLFLGKPVLAVEHHSYFRDGYRSLEEFVAGLHALAPRIEWTSLETICSRACQLRALENGDLQVRFYTNQFQLENDTGRNQNYDLFRLLPPDEGLPSVTVEGRQQKCEREANSLKIRISLTPGQAADVRVVAPQADRVESVVSETLAHNVSVGLRRLLCELRDNYIHTNPVVQRFFA